jgi:hypothetical protein
MIPPGLKRRLPLPTTADPLLRRRTACAGRRPVAPPAPGVQHSPVTEDQAS